MSFTAAVLGASGYAGGELLRLIAGHPSLNLGAMMAGSRAGDRVDVVHPQLTALTDHLMAPTDPQELSNADVVFLALPHGESAALMAHIPAQVRVVDLGADYRLTDAGAWEAYYGGSHAGTWLYGLPEFGHTRQLLAGATRVANPGCYPTAVTLAMAPLLAADVIARPEVVVVAASGTSGAGRKATEALSASSVLNSMSAYKVGGNHQHTPEMEQSLAAAADEPVTVSFTPLLAPMTRGILATVSAPVNHGVSTDDVRDIMHSSYAAESFVHLLAPGQWPHTAATFGSNSVHLQATVDEHAHRVVVVAAIDNLIKGAAGQAIQNANLMLGINEQAGLTAWGVAP